MISQSVAIVSTPNTQLLNSSHLVADDAGVVSAAVELDPHADRPRVFGERQEPHLARHDRGSEVVLVPHVRIRVSLQELEERMGVRLRS